MSKLGTASVITIEQTARKLGICMILTLDGNLAVFPSRVANKYPAFCKVLEENQELIKSWLRLLAAP